jgi:hypothetical protein
VKEIKQTKTDSSKNKRKYLKRKAKKEEEKLKKIEEEQQKLLNNGNNNNMINTDPNILLVDDVNLNLSVTKNHRTHKGIRFQQPRLVFYYIVIFHCCYLFFYQCILL